MTVKTSLNRALRIIALMALGLACITANESPAAAQGFSIASIREEFLVSPGGKLIGAIPVTNTSDEPVSVRIYVADWVRVSEQTSGYGFDEEGGNEPRSFLDWMTFGPERLTLEPGETREVTYEVNVPDDLELAGSYWGVIFIEGIPSEEPQLVPVGEGEMAIGITTLFRYAVQVIATIEDTEIREASFISLKMEPAEGGFNAIAVFENMGNIYIKPKVWLDLLDTAGEVVYKQEHSERTVLPESARDFVFELRDLQIESGEYMVMIYADYGVPTLIAAQGRVTLKIEPSAPEEKEAATVEEETGEPEEPPVVEEPEKSE